MRARIPAQPSPVAEAGEGFALVEGLRGTRGAIDAWREDPRSILVPWFMGAAAVAAGLLTAVWIVSLLAPPDYTGLPLPGIDGSRLDYLRTIIGRNLLVLALHATACVAGFIAGSSLRQVAPTKTGLSRIVHERAGPVAIAWVIAVTTFSLLTQSFGLGFIAATLAGQLQISSFVLILTVLPHALIELTAVFLPLAAWLFASRRDEWDELLAATMVTVALALPMVLCAAAIEVTLWPQLLELVSPVV